MDDVLGNHKYVIYMKKGDFSQPKKCPEVAPFLVEKKFCTDFP